MIQALPWPGWINAKQDLLSGESGCLFHQFCLWRPICWLPPFPSTTYFGSEKQLPPITGPNSIRQGILLKVFVFIRFWGVDSSCAWKPCAPFRFWSLHNLWPSAFISISLSPLPPPSVPWPHPSHKTGVIALNLGSQILVVIRKPYVFFWMLSNPKTLLACDFGVQFVLRRGTCSLFANCDLKFTKKLWRGFEAY
jgi:hypothetical protein